MARKASKKLIDASDKLVLHYTSHSSEEMDAPEYASSDDNYDLIIKELDYVNSQIATIQNVHPYKPVPKGKKTAKRKSATRSGQTEWKNVNDLMTYFPSLPRNEITAKLCALQPTMQDKIMKRGRLMALHISALTEFAHHAGLTIAAQNGDVKRKSSARPKKSKKQRTDKDNMVYVIQPKPLTQQKTSRPPRQTKKNGVKRTAKFQSGTATLKKHQQEIINAENMVYIIKPKTK